MHKNHKKTCNNSECKLEFYSINPKQKYCSLKCKNRENYLQKEKKFSEEHYVYSQRIKNYYILERIIDKNTEEVTKTELENFGFDFSVCLVSVTHFREGVLEHYFFENIIMDSYKPDLFKIFDYDKEAHLKNIPNLIREYKSC